MTKPALEVNKLHEFRTSILKLEVAALMALWDKTGSRSSPNEVLREIELANTNLRDFRDKLRLYEVEVNGEKIKLWKDFLEDWRRKSSKIIKNIYRCSENYNSSVDKGTPADDVKVEPRDKKWLANAYGGFKDWIWYAEGKEEEIQDFINCIGNEFVKILDYEELDYQNLKDFRQKVYFLTSRLLSDDRFPINDISLWDQAYMAASMFKACLAEGVMKGSLDIDMKNYGWRILGIQYDKLGIAEKGHKPSHIKWYREKAGELDEKIKELLEFTYPIGNEIYRDETGIYFLIGEGLGEDNEDGSACISDDLACLKGKIFAIFGAKTGGEFYPAVFVSSSSRGLMQLGYLLDKARENFLHVERVKEIKTGGNDCYLGICQVCRKRLVEEGTPRDTDEAGICSYCRKEKSRRRIEGWLQDINGETIWMSELRDESRQVALVTLKFELRDWLNGNMLNTCLLRKIDYDRYVRGIKSFIILLLSGCDWRSCFNMKDLDNKIESLENKIRQNLENRKGFIEEKRILSNDKKSLNEVLKIIDLLRNERWYEKKLSENFGDYKKEVASLCEIIISKYSEVNGWKIPLLDDFIFFPSELAPEAYGGCKGREETFEDFIRQIFFNSIYGNEWEQWIRKSVLNDRIDWDNKSIRWDKFKSENDPALEMLASLLLQFMIRKNPSPARTARVWENTKAFFADIKKNLLFYADMPEERRKRPVWKNKGDNRLVEKLDGELEEGEYFDGDALFYCAESDIYLISYLPKKERSSWQKEKIFNLRRYPNGDKIVARLTWPEKSDGRDFDLVEYVPYFSIIDPTPVSWQFVIPAEYLPSLIGKIREKYDEWFGFVYGKLPLHIGVVVQDYHKPLYVGINALRRIRRDIDCMEGIADYRKAGFAKEKIRKINEHFAGLGLTNDPVPYYSLYWGKDLPLKEGYRFYVRPDDKESRIICPLDKIDDDKEICIMPNTFDFEFMDTNIRRNDIFYEVFGDEKTGGSRVRRRRWLKNNRPYDIDVFWPKLEKFRELFGKAGEVRRTRLQKLMGVIYEYVENAEEVKTFLASSLVNILDLNKDEELRKGIAELMDIEGEDGSFYESLVDRINPYYLKMLIDMFQFCHTALKEV